MRRTAFCLLLTLVFVCTWSFSFAAQKNNKNNNNNVQERKDDAKVNNERADVSEATKKLQADLKELKLLEAAAKKSQDGIASAKRSMDDTSDRLKKWISQNLGIPQALEAQKNAQAVYDETAKPIIEAMKSNPKYMPAIERAEKANAVLKALATDTQTNEATRRQQQAEASKALADWRITMSSYLDAHPDLKYPREKLTAAQSKYAELVAQLKKQLELHPDMKAAEKKLTQARESHEKDLQQIATLKRKSASDQAKLVAEKSQLSKSMIQDKQNDGKNNNNNKKNNNNNKKKNNNNNKNKK
ncbi:MAG: hypothetical protein SGI77_02430 [Pirellulaceae bacterium]|nr:hypothetical protein [Pirellulaceae bacterium]